MIRQTAHVLSRTSTSVIPLHWNEEKLAYTARDAQGISSCLCLLQTQSIIHGLVADMTRDVRWNSLSEKEKYRRARSTFFQDVAQTWGVPYDPSVIDAWPIPGDIEEL